MFPVVLPLEKWYYKMTKKKNIRTDMDPGDFHL